MLIVLTETKNGMATYYFHYGHNFRLLSEAVHSTPLETLPLIYSYSQIAKVRIARANNCWQ